MTGNVDTVKVTYDCFGRGDVPGILERLAPDVEWEHDWGATPLKWDQRRRGHDGVLQFLGALADFEFLRFEPLAFLEGDGMVDVPIRLELRV
jgi:ketosteroid isomerase-like protein